MRQQRGDEGSAHRADDRKADPFDDVGKPDDQDDVFLACPGLT